MPKKSSSGGITKDLVSRVRDAPSLPALLELLAEAKGQELGAGPLAAILNTLATKAASDVEGRAGEALSAGEALLEAAVAHSGGRPPESAVTVMVRLCCIAGAPERALSLVEEARVAGMKPKLRTLAAILAQAAKAGDRQTCDGVWAKLSSYGLEPQDTEYAAMLRGLRGVHMRQREVLKQLLIDLPLPSDPPLIEEIGRAFGVEGAMAFRCAALPYGEGLQEDGGQWRVGWTSIDTAGRCALSKRRLQALRISAAEERELFACTAKLANDSGFNKGFKLFQKWLREQEPYDVIIDGANVGFNNQNHEGGHFQYQQIDAVVQHFQSAGQRALLVLHPKWLREDADLSVVRRKRRKFDQVSKDSPTRGVGGGEDEDEDDGDTNIVYPHDGVTDAEREAPLGSPSRMIRAWKELGCLVCVPFYDCDDWYWLYAALDSFQRGREHVQVVSNDQMRDHHWRMDGSRSFLQWQDRHMTRVSIQTAEPGGQYSPQLYPPRPYSFRAQVSEDQRAWHFPVPAIRSRAEQLQSGRPVAHKEIETAEHRWLVAWQDLPSPTLS